MQKVFSDNESTISVKIVFAWGPKILQLMVDQHINRVTLRLIAKNYI